MSGFHLEQPWALLWLLAAWGLVRLMRRGDAARALAARRLRMGRVSERRWAQRTIAWAVVLLAVAAARPAMRSAPLVRPRSGDVAILLDVSRSMLTRDVSPSRLGNAKAIAAGLIGQLRGERVALIAFAGSAALLSPLTGDYDYVRAQLRDAGAESVARGGTNIAGALRVAGDAGFDDVMRAWKQIMVISDGGDRSEEAEVAAHELERRAIRVASIGVGTLAGRFVPASESDQAAFLFQGRPVWTRLNEGALKAISQRYWRGNEVFDTAAAYRTITSEGSKPDAPVETDLYPFLLAGAALLLALEWMPLNWRDWRAPKTIAASLAMLVWQSSAPLDYKPKDPETAQGLVAESKSGLEWNDYNVAKRLLTKAAELSARTPEIEFDLGQTYYRLDDYLSAQIFFGQAAKHSRDKEQKARCLLGQGNAQFRIATGVFKNDAAKQLQGAIDLYGEALQLDPKLADAKFNLEVARQKLLSTERPIAANTPLPESKAAFGPEAADAEEILRRSEKRRQPGGKTERVGADW